MAFNRNQGGKKEKHYYRFDDWTHGTMSPTRHCVILGARKKKFT